MKTMCCVSLQACSRNKSLYLLLQTAASDGLLDGHQCTVCRIDATDGQLLTSWPIDDRQPLLDALHQDDMALEDEDEWFIGNLFRYRRELMSVDKRDGRVLLSTSVSSYCALVEYNSAGRVIRQCTYGPNARDIDRLSFCQLQCHGDAPAPCVALHSSFYCENSSVSLIKAGPDVGIATVWRLSITCKPVLSSRLSASFMPTTVKPVMSWDFEQVINFIFIITELCCRTFWRNDDCGSRTRGIWNPTERLNTKYDDRDAPLTQHQRSGI